MRLDVHVHVHLADPRPSSVQETLDTILHHLLRQETQMSQQFDHLRQEVAEMSGTVQSAVTLIRSLSSQIRDLKDDPAALEALAQELDASAGDLGAAVAENSPAGESPTDPGGEEPPTDPSLPSSDPTEANLAAG
jgi:TolA-binding protein